jgi:hypothetical protein
MAVLGVLAAQWQEGPAEEGWELVEGFSVGQVWSGHPVGFCLYTAPPWQYVAFYDANRQMTVAARRLEEREWRYQRLPSVLGWDSHNSIVMALDSEGYLHLSGNMHVSPLVYFRTKRPYDITSFEQIPAMTGENEDRVTYPQFLQDGRGRLYFLYRDGASGRGRQWVNTYDPDRQKWTRLLDKPLLDGGEQMSAYPSGPMLGPDGRWHLCWMWRETPDCATNRDLCYARSNNLVDWETVDGRPLQLPITPATEGVVVDRVPPGAGLINFGHRVGFDHQGRPLIAYHKYDAQGHSQIFNARWEENRWVIYQSSSWDYRWDFRGPGTIVGEIFWSPVSPAADGRLRQAFSHVRFGSGVWILEEATLQPVATLPKHHLLPAELLRPEVDFPGMEVRVVADAGKAPSGERYLLRWESLPANRDRPREQVPPPSPLRVYRLRQQR